MINLLPQENRRKISREYKLRLFIIVLIFSLFTLLFLAISMTPSLFLSFNKNKIAVETVYASYSDKTKSADSIEKILKETSDKIKAINIDGGGKRIIEILDRIIAERETIKLVSFEISPAVENARRVTLSGDASNRNTLVGFERRLKESSEFFNINLPVSSLTKEININFSLSLDVKK